MPHRFGKSNTDRCTASIRCMLLTLSSLKPGIRFIHVRFQQLEKFLNFHLYKSLAIDVDIRLGSQGDTINLRILYNLGSTEVKWTSIQKCLFTYIALEIDQKYHQVSSTCVHTELKWTSIQKGLSTQIGKMSSAIPSRKSIPSTWPMIRYQN